MASPYPAYPPQLTAEQDRYLRTNLQDWAIAHGLAVRPAAAFIEPERDPGGALAATAPVTLFPSLFPRSCFEQAQAVATAYNALYAAIASDAGWLKGIVEELAEIDKFMEGLWKIHTAVEAEGYAQSIELGLFRSDYMVHLDPPSSTASSGPSIKQVEFNTIASSFGGLSARVSELHRYLRQVEAFPESASSTITADSLPQNDSIQSLARGIATGHEAYGPGTGDLPLCVIFLVQSPERNVFDQRHIEYTLNENHGIRTFRLPFDQVLADTKVDSSRRLLFTPPELPHKSYEVTVVYFRAGYAPEEYIGADHWAGRLQLERSSAIKCPSVLTQLAGTKKVQQVPATHDSPPLARFLPDTAAAASIRSTFAAIYPLDDSAAGQDARRWATDPEHARRYVLKPQREGGGNNIYRAAIPPFLQSLAPAQWPAYILMEMIEPPAQRNTILRQGVVQSGGVICELGIYGACVWDAGKRDGSAPIIRANFRAGHLLRTKGDTSEEGGVAAGFGSVDSPCLVGDSFVSR